MNEFNGEIRKMIILSKATLKMYTAFARQTAHVWKRN